MDNQLFELLENSYKHYNCKGFIMDDPIQIPHLFSGKEDIEISGFLTATIAWGQRRTIINNAKRLMEWMDFSPYDFVINHSEKDLKPFAEFVHRTFNGDDCLFFIESLKNIYLNKQGLEYQFTKPILEGKEMINSIVNYRNNFLDFPHLHRSEKHISNPAKGASAKRINMFLRWMVRQDDNGVDFGIWKQIPASKLMCPLDVHSGNVARTLGLLSRAQNDWKSVEELTSNLRLFDPEDPVKYDFALFGTGVNTGRIEKRRIKNEE